MLTMPWSCTFWRSTFPLYPYCTRDVIFPRKQRTHTAIYGQITNYTFGQYINTILTIVIILDPCMAGSGSFFELNLCFLYIWCQMCSHCFRNPCYKKNISKCTYLWLTHYIIDWWITGCAKIYQTQRSQWLFRYLVRPCTWFMRKKCNRQFDYFKAFAYICIVKVVWLFAVTYGSLSISIYSYCL